MVANWLIQSSRCEVFRVAKNLSAPRGSLFGQMKWANCQLCRGAGDAVDVAHFAAGARLRFAV
ncbi:MAG: hypothetical protein ACI9U6_000901, partial [Loktanella salsilacus]